MRTKRMISFLLALVMVLAVVPNFALADNEETEPAEAVTYTVTFDANGGTAVSPVSVQEGATVAAPQIVRDGYKLIGWYTTAVVNGQSVAAEYDFSTPVNSDLTLQAQWSAIVPKNIKMSSKGLMTTSPVYVASIVRNDEVVQPFATLAEAFAAAQNNDTIKLLQDVSLTDRLFINAGATPTYDGTNRYATTSENKALTLDLNGKNITTASNIALAGGSLNIIGTGKITSNGSGLAPIEIRGTGYLATKRTLVIGAGVTLEGGAYGLNIFGSNDEQKNVMDITINGTVKGTVFVLGNLKNAANAINIVVNGTVTANAASNEDVNVGIALNGNANVTVNAGAAVSGDSGIEVRAGKLTVNGGTITATAQQYSYTANGSGCTTKGAAIAVAQHTTMLPVDVTLNGGTLSGVNMIGITDVNNDMSAVKVAATQSFREHSEIPEDYTWNAAGKLVSEYAAKIGENKYETLEAAFAAAVDGSTITVLADCSGNGIIAEQGKFKTNGLTVDFKGFTYTVNGATLAGSTGTKTQAFQLLKDNKITFKDGAIVGDASNVKMLIQNYSDLTLDNMVLDATQGTNSVGYVLSTNNGSTTINNTTITAKSDGIAFDVCSFGTYTGNSVTVTGNSTINGDVEISSSNVPAGGLNLVLESGTMTGKLVNGGIMEGTNVTGTKADGFEVASTDFKWVDGTLTVIEYVARIGTVKYETLNAALKAAQSGETIKLLANVDDATMGSKGIEVNGDKNITLDLAGHNITCTDGSVANNRMITIKGTTTLNVVNTSATVSTMSVCGDDASKIPYGVFRNEEGTTLNITATNNNIVLKNGRGYGLNVKVLGGVANLNGVVIESTIGGGIEVTEADLGNHSQAGLATLTNCKFTQSGYSDHCSTAISVSGGSKVTVNSGTYTGEYALYVFSSGGEIEVKGGTFIGLEKNNRAAIVAAIDLNTYSQYTGGLKISGGNFTGTFNITSPAYMTISGGYFTADPSAYLAKGYEEKTSDITGYNYMVGKCEHNFTYDYTKPNWLWTVINGTWSVSSTYTGTCTCGETGTQTLTATVVTTDNTDSITYTATDERNNSDTRTLQKTFTVTYGGQERTYLYGAACKLESDVVSDWYVGENLRAVGTKTFYFPVTETVTVTTKAPTATTQQATSNADVQTSAGKMVYHFTWSIPEGSQVVSAVIYRCKDNEGAIDSFEKLKNQHNLRTYDTKMYVRNGEFTYTVTNLTPGNKQTIMFHLVYTLDGQTCTLNTPIKNVTIQ